MNDVDYARAYYQYDEHSGSVVYLDRPDSEFSSDRSAATFRGKTLGKQSVAKGANGGYAVSFKGRKISLPRLIWLIKTGDWPMQPVCHANSNPKDNGWSNLYLSIETHDRNIDARYISECLSYNKDTGIFLWTARPLHHFTRLSMQQAWNGTYTGEIAGSKDNTGYMVVTISGKRMKLHRVAWLFHTRAWPEDQVDHVNGVRDDNRITNLRAVSRSQNGRNAKIRSSNTSGTTGVYWWKDRGKWQASISDNGKLKSLGFYASIGDAITARKAAEKALGYDSMHGVEQSIRSKRDLTNQPTGEAPCQK